MIHDSAGSSGGWILPGPVLTCAPTEDAGSTVVSSRGAYHCEETSAVYSNSS